MNSNSKGKGQVFWQEKGVAPAFFRDRSKSFDVQHDGEAHQYRINWSPAQPVAAIRIDPSSGAGKMRISNLKLSSSEGNVLHQWQF